MILFEDASVDLTRKSPCLGCEASIIVSHYVSGWVHRKFHWNMGNGRSGLVQSLVEQRWTVGGSGSRDLANKGYISSHDRTMC